MQKYKSNITSTTGAAIRNVPVTVLNEAGELASLFLDRAGAIAAPNPLVTDSSGNFYFYAVNGRYSLRTTVEGVTITDDDVVLLQDPVEITVAGPIAEAIAAAQAAARQAQDVVDSSGIPDMVAAAQNAVIDSNQALQEARGASLASAEAKQAAESAKGAAELAKGDAQAASSTANTAAQQANAAAQSAAQSAASIDPARLLTPAERQKLDGIGATTAPLITDIDSLRAYGVYRTTAAVMLAASGPESDCVIFHLPGSTANSGHRQIAFPITSSGTYIGREYSRAQWGGAWQAWDEAGKLSKANTWNALQTFTAGAVLNRVGINGTWNTGIGIYCTDTTFTANSSISGINFDISTNADALTASRTYRAAYLRVRGNNTPAQLAGFTNTLTGAEGVAEGAAAVDGVGEANYLFGFRGYATDNSARTLNTTGAYGGHFTSQHTGISVKTVTDSSAVHAYLANGNANTTITNGHGLYSWIANTGTITSSYLVRGIYTGAGTFGSKWGIHLSGSTMNQIDGWLNLTSTTDSTSATTGALRVAGGLGVAKTIYAGVAVYAPEVTADAVVTTSVNGGQLAGRRNKIHNGAMRINQLGFYATSPGRTGIDRWFYGGSHDGGITFSNVDVTSSLLPSGFTTAMRATVVAADTSIAAGQSAFVCQRIEGFDVIDLVGQTFTFSCWVRVSLAGTYCLSFRAVGGDRSWVTAISLAANTWTKVVTTIPAGLPTGGTWNYTNGVGLEVGWALACGASLHTATVNAWTNTAAMATAANANLLAATGRTFDITGVQLEKGDRATPFELMGIMDETFIVQRYLQVYNGIFNLGTNAGVDAVNLNRHLFSQPMRTTPTVTQAFAGTGGSWIAVNNAGFGQSGYHSIITPSTTLYFSAEL
ncbi:hypothetical protein [Comamonas terrigena]|uniref:hypothetical protein n=1 Tax=Comamonas terrigena TaxID=32013 RepID=UPI002449F37D|nr:hypothetical protein [Comamonas terrigena]MDH1700971.1 hypothetical protein [Comamonas terrigena]